ncbi:MAG TPA: XdhC family protein [Actinomycetota bacterium]|nr:XdhC family protein [Actinomycetota bacterium]
MNPNTQIEELLIVGTGPVARALVAIGEPMGYHVRVAAGPQTPRVGEFDGADEVIVTPESTDVEAIRPSERTTVVVCAEDREFSKRVVRSLASTRVPYLGMLDDAPELLETLRADGLSHEALERIHIPMGLDINAVTPEEVAVSVFAEIIKVKLREA